MRARARYEARYRAGAIRSVNAVARLPRCCFATYWNSLGAATVLGALGNASNSSAWSIDGDGTIVVRGSGTSAVYWRRTLIAGSYGRQRGHSARTHDDLLREKRVESRPRRKRGRDGCGRACDAGPTQANADRTSVGSQRRHARCPTSSRELPWQRHSSAATKRSRSIAAIARVATLAACAYPKTGVHVTGRTHGVAAVAARRQRPRQRSVKHHRIRGRRRGDDRWTPQRKTSSVYL